MNAQQVKEIISQSGVVAILRGDFDGWFVKIAQTLADAGVPTPVRGFGVPKDFHGHGKREQVLERIGLTAQDVARQVVELVARSDAALTPADAEP